MPCFPKTGHKYLSKSEVSIATEVDDIADFDDEDGKVVPGNKVLKGD